jgi:hypothetical protein
MHKAKAGRPCIPDHLMTPEQLQRREYNRRYRQKNRSASNVVPLDAPPERTADREDDQIIKPSIYQTHKSGDLIITGDYQIINFTNQSFYQIGQFDYLRKKHISQIDDILNNRVSQKEEFDEYSNSSYSMNHQIKKTVDDQMLIPTDGGLINDQTDSLLKERRRIEEEIEQLKKQHDLLINSLNHQKIKSSISTVFVNWARSVTAPIKHPVRTFWLLASALLILVMGYLQYDFYAAYEPGTHFKYGLDLAALLKSSVCELLLFVLGLHLRNSSGARWLWGAVFLYTAFVLSYSVVDDSIKKLRNKETIILSNPLKEELLSIGMSLLKESSDKGRPGDTRRYWNDLKANLSEEGSKAKEEQPTQAQQEDLARAKWMIYSLGFAFVFLRLIFMAANAWIADRTRLSFERE